MWKDSLVEEIRKIREQHAAQFDYNIAAIVEALQQEEEHSGRRIVSFAQKPEGGQTEPKSLKSMGKPKKTLKVA